MVVHRAREALLSGDWVLHLLGRVGARLWLLLSPWGWVGTPTDHLVLVLLTAADLVLAARMRRTGKHFVPLRVVVSIAELAYWAVGIPGSYAGAVGVVVPVLIVVALRSSFTGGFLAGLLVVSAASAVRAARALPMELVDALVYVTISVVVARLVLWELTRQLARDQQRREDVEQAELRAAEARGRNDVVVGAHAAIIDDLQTSIMKLTAGGVDAARLLRGKVADHKRELAEQTRGSAVYLSEALESYATVVRTRNPRLAEHVYFHIDPASRTAVLTVDQAAQLRQALVTTAPKGVQAVRAVPGTTGPDSLSIIVGEETIELHGSSPTPAVSIAGLSLVLLGLMTLTASDPVRAAVPLWVTGPLAVVAAGAGVLVSRLDRPGADRQAATVVGTAVFLVTVAIVARVDLPQNPLSGPLVGLGFVLGLGTRTRLDRCRAASAFASAVLLAAWAARGVDAVYVVTDAIWAAEIFIGTAVVVSVFDRPLPRVVEGIDEARAAARSAGAAAEVAYLHDVLRSGEELLPKVQDAPIRVMVTAEFHEVRRRLDSLSEATDDAIVRGG